MRVAHGKVRGDDTPVTGGVKLPARLRRAVPPTPENCPSDPVDKQLVRMQLLHSNLRTKFRCGDLEKMDSATKAKLLADIQDVLRIKPLSKHK